MAKYIVTYDLDKPGQKYTNLIAAIKQYGSWAKVTESSWFIGTSDTAKAVCENLMKNLDNNDRLMVAALTGAASWSNCIAGDDDLKNLLNSN